jgi:RNA polymerase sigma-70 factor, ECF subfamily
MPEAQQFEAFMQQYQNMVFSTALRLLANPTEAEDISQEVFLRAYEHFPELRTSPTAPGWLRKVATNLSLNHLSRYRARWSFFSELADPGEDPGPEPEFAAAGNLAQDLESADRQQLIENAIHKLPAAQRVPLILYHIEGFQYEEIAARLKVSLGKVKTDIFRGRETLRKRLHSALANECTQ